MKRRHRAKLTANEKNTLVRLLVEENLTLNGVNARFESLQWNPIGRVTYSKYLKTPTVQEALATIAQNAAQEAREQGLADRMKIIRFIHTRLEQIALTMGGGEWADTSVVPHVAVNPETFIALVEEEVALQKLLVRLTCIPISVEDEDEYTEETDKTMERVVKLLELAGDPISIEEDTSGDEMVI